MHALRLPVRRLVPLFRYLPHHTGSLAKEVNVGIIAAAVGTKHVDMTVETIPDVCQEPLELLRGGVLRPRE